MCKFLVTFVIHTIKMKMITKFNNLKSEKK